jgi:hypothetical protein
MINFVRFAEFASFLVLHLIIVLSIIVQPIHQHSNRWGCITSINQVVLLDLDTFKPISVEQIGGNQVTRQSQVASRKVHFQVGPFDDHTATDC